HADDRTLKGGFRDDAEIRKGPCRLPYRAIGEKDKGRPCCPRKLGTARGGGMLSPRDEIGRRARLALAWPLQRPSGSESRRGHLHAQRVGTSVIDYGETTHVQAEGRQARPQRGTLGYHR